MACFCFSPSRTTCSDLLKYFYRRNDTLPKNSLFRLFSLLKKSDLDVVYGDVCYGVENHIVRYWGSSGFYPWKLSFGDRPPHPALFVRRNLFLELGGFDLRYRIASDFDFMLRLFRKNRKTAYFKGEPLVLMAQGGLSRQFFLKGNTEAIISCIRVLGYINPLWFLVRPLILLHQLFFADSLFKKKISVEQIRKNKELN
jgi:glycosyltransferase